MLSALNQMTHCADEPRSITGKFGSDIYNMTYNIVDGVVSVTFNALKRLEHNMCISRQTISNTVSLPKLRRAVTSDLRYDYWLGSIFYRTVSNAKKT